MDAPTEEQIQAAESNYDVSLDPEKPFYFEAHILHFLSKDLCEITGVSPVTVPKGIASISNLIGSVSNAFQIRYYCCLFYNKTHRHLGCTCTSWYATESNLLICSVNWDQFIDAANAAILLKLTTFTEIVGDVEKVTDYTFQRNRVRLSNSIPVIGDKMFLEENQVFQTFNPEKHFQVITIVLQ
jgi:hypothetical protein